MGACPICSAENPAGARFCNGCGARLGGTTAPAHEERKTVTVLFADLAGFTARSETLDPEDVLSLVRPFHDLLRAEAERFGGTLARIVGDAGMVVFGYPAAHEDDPERAVRAGLALLAGLERLDAERPGLDLHARIGINTAEAVVTYGSALEDADDLMGDGVNTAARLQAAAPVDGVVVGAATHAATRHLFRYEALSPVAAKGKAEPLELWRALAPIARLQRDPAETTPFVGRDLELGSLVRLFERSRSLPTVEVVTVVADPGIGKSRLVRELGRHVDGLPDLVTWRVGRCLPYGEGISFWALGEIVKAHAAILDSDDQATSSAKLDAVLTEPDASLRAWMMDRIGPLVGLSTTTEPPRAEEAFTAWRRFLEEMARARPTVLVVEDLHWADDAFIAFLQHVAERSTGLPLLIVSTARPEVRDRHPGWLAGAPPPTVLHLRGLSDPEMRRLVEATLPDAAPGTLETILYRAGGSPLYAEQLAAMFRDRPVVGGPSVQADAIPPGIAALLAARIDALPADLKAVLLDASVVGKTFWSGAVAHLAGRDAPMVDPLLADLARRDLARPVSLSSMEGEAEYSFVHALVRDVAYSELPRAARMAKHRAAASWIVEHVGAALGEEAEIVVGHLDRARELASTLGSTEGAAANLESLVTALLAAADHAMATQPPRATGHLRRVLDLLDPVDPRRPAVLTLSGRASLVTLDFAEAARVLQEAADLLTSRGDAVAAAGIAVHLSIALSNSGDIERSARTLAEARTALHPDPGAGLVPVLAEQAMQAMVASRHDLAISLADEAIDLSRELGLPLSHRALVARGCARFGEDPAGGEADLRLAIERAEADGDLYAGIIAFYDLASCRDESLGPAAGLSVADEGVAFAEARGLPTERIRASRLELLLMAGRWDELMAEAADLRAWAIEHGDAATRVIADGARTTVMLERGERTGSLADIAAAGREVGFPPMSYAAIVAEADLADGRPDDARRVLQAALEATPAGEATELAGFVRACLRAGTKALARRALAVGAAPAPITTVATVAAEAMLAEADGDPGLARAGYARATEGCAVFGMAPEHAHALAGLGRCALALGDIPEGVARLHASREIWELLGAAPRIAEIDAVLATAG